MLADGFSETDHQGGRLGFLNVAPGPLARHLPVESGAEETESHRNEGSGIGQENLHEVQDHSPARGGARDLRQPQASPAPGLI
jgi:hypothetical protein